MSEDNDNPVDDEDKAPTAAEVEATDTPEGYVRFEYGGQSYIGLANPQELDGDYYDAIMHMPADYPKAIRTLLGPDQWARFKSTRPKVKDYSPLIAAYGAALGVEDQGE